MPTFQYRGRLQEAQSWPKARIRRRKTRQPFLFCR
jgi:hypothetical protein